ncbi:MAG TPA: hypothetical protein V6C81_07185 [Planktothrix sp.]|jgi:hypothetical protein
MNKNDLLANAGVAAPCSAGWENMNGDERKRFCALCQKNVYNIAEMSTKDAINLIEENEGNLCMRLYRRKDGTIVTDNCPVGLRKIRDRAGKIAFALGIAIPFLMSASAAHAQGLIGAPIEGRFGQSNEVPTEISITDYLPSFCHALIESIKFSLWLNYGRAAMKIWRHGRSRNRVLLALLVLIAVPIVQLIGDFVINHLGG